ncbi:MAG: hypothetical protein WC728_05495, partial [Elusimicrobiota bacterium]
MDASGDRARPYQERAARGISRRQRGLITAALAFAVAALAPASSWAAFPRKIATGGTTAASNQRHVVFNQEWGFWVFFSQGTSGAYNPVWSHSSTGAEGTWSEPAAIFDGTAYSGFANKPTVWYVHSSSEVYIAVASEEAMGPFYFRRGRVNFAGGIDWIEDYRYQGYPDCDPARKQIIANAPISFTLDKSSRAWMNILAVDEADTSAGEDALVFYTTGTRPGSISYWYAGSKFSDGLTCISDGSDHAIQYANVVVPHPVGSGSNMVWYSGYLTDNSDPVYPRVWNEGGVTANTSEISAPTRRDGEGTAGGLNVDRNATMVVDGSGNLHWAYVDANYVPDAQINYMRCTSANSCANEHRADAAGGSKHITMAVAYASSTKNTDKIFLFFSDSEDDGYVLEAATNPTSTGNWTKTLFGANMTHLSAAYSVTQPDPLPVVFTGGGKVQFDWWPTSNMNNPSVAGISITSTPANAPYSQNPYKITIIGGQYFATLGTKQPSVVFLKNGLYQEDISVLSTTRLSDSSAEVELEVVPPVAGGCYDLKFINPDARSDTKANALCLDAPKVTAWWDPDPRDGKLSGAVFPVNSGTEGFTRDIAVQGTGFMDWGGDNTVRLEAWTGSLVPGVTYSTITNISPGVGAGSFLAKLKISTATPFGTYNLRVTNPDGQYFLQASTFIVTVPTASVTYPVLGNGLSAQPGDPLRPMTTGFAVIKGGMYFNPRLGQAESDGGASTGTQIRIRRNSDGYYWNPVDGVFQPANWFESEETLFINTGSSEPWSYSWSPEDGEYDIAVRGRTSDQPKDGGGGYTGAGGPESTTVRLIKDNRAPLVGILQPARGSGAQAASAYPLQFTLDEMLGHGNTGTGVQKAYYLVMATHPLAANTTPYLSDTATTTWVSWCKNPDVAGCSCGPGWCWDTGNPGAQRWISTTTTASPALQWGTKSLFRSISISSHTGDVRIPEWKDGTEYYVAVVATDALGQVGTSETSQSTGSWAEVMPVSDAGFRFIYDVTVPTVSAHASLLDISTDSTSQSWVTSFTVASGTVKDNVSNLVSPRKVYMRIFDDSIKKYLNPGTLIKFDLNMTDGNSAWAELSTILDDWAYDMPSAQFATGNKYIIEVYGGDGAGNQDASQCPFNDAAHPPASQPNDCRTGSGASPKFLRYFSYDKAKPSVTIATPTATNPNYLGGTYVLNVASGQATDRSVSLNESKVAYVEFALQQNAADPCYHWEHYETSGSWKANYVGDIWNRAYPQGPAGDPWAVWTTSNIAWFESDAYVMKVRAFDNAGNQTVSDATLSFLYDKAKPTSRITYPANDQVYTAHVLTLSGTAIDDTSTSTGTSSGLSSLGVKIVRESDGWHWNGAAWAPPAASSITVAVAQGTGLKNWTLDIPAKFYDDLLVTRDTFTVYCWGTDMVNNPSEANANKEDETPKVTYVFQSDYPIVRVHWPSAASAEKDVSSMTVSVDAVGSGIAQIWAVVLTTHGYYWTGSSWSQTYDHNPNPNPNDYNLWLTTDSAGNGSPDMVFTPPVSQQDIRVSFLPGTTLKTPGWVSGSKYRIYVKARNSAGQETNSWGGTYAFLYDVDKPTLTLSSTLAALSDTEADRSWVRSMDLLDGTMLDNTPDALNIYSVFAKIYSESQSKCLSPTANPPRFNYECGSQTAGWKELQVTGASALRSWDTVNLGWDLANADWTGGYLYTLEIYAQDKAGNSTGTVTAPLFKKYFRYDKDKPLLTVSTPVAGGAYGLDSLSLLMGYSMDPTAGYPSQVDYSLGYGLYKWEDSPPGWVEVGDPEEPLWNVATTTTTPENETWNIESVAWQSGRQYTLVARAQDPAGNYSTYSTSTFKYDTAAPDTKVTVPPVDDRVYSQKITVIGGTSIDMPNFGTQAGILNMKVGIQRLSDSQWWNGDAWEPGRSDYLMPPPSGESWTHGSIGGFWDTVPAAETFEVYAWAQDKVDDPSSGYRNIENSGTMKRRFKYEVQPPTSTILVPAHYQWYSSQAGYDLPDIMGTAVDLPLSGVGSGGGVDSMQVQVRRGNNDSYCWGGADFTQSCGEEAAWTNMSRVDQDTFTFSTTLSGLWDKTRDGESYRVRIRSKDSARDGSESPSPNVETLNQEGRNERIFKVDTSTPSSPVQSPATQDNSLLTKISGTADDSNAGVLDVRVAYYGETEGGGRWWNPANGLFELGSYESDPPEAAFVPASTQTAKPVPWEVAGGSLPAFGDGQFYRVFARSVDKAGLKAYFPGHANVTTPPAMSSFIRIRKTVSEPQSGFTTPPLGTPHYRPADLATIVGTVTDATTAQIRIVNTTPDPDQVWQWSGGWVSTDTYAGLLGCPDSHFLPDASTCGFHGAANLTWTRSVAGIWAAGTNRYEIEVRGVNGTQVEGGSFEKRDFVVDADAPTPAITWPSATAAKAGAVKYASATASDVSPGVLQELNPSTQRFIIMRMRAGAETEDYRYTGTGFTATTNYMLTPQKIGSVYQYTDADMLADTVFEDGRQYKIAFCIKDKAGNETPACGGSYMWLDAKVFRYDKTIPAVGISAPAPNALLNSAAPMAGSTSDPDPDEGDSNIEASGVQGVEILLKSQAGALGNNGYWNGGTVDGISSWDTDDATKYAQWQPVSGDVANWSKAFPPMTWLDSTEFTLWVRSKDYALNYSTHPTKAGAQPQMDGNLNPDSSPALTFMYDISSPTTRVTYPPAFTRLIGFASVSGTSTDDYWEGGRNPTGVSSVYFKLRRSDGYYYSMGWTPGDPGWVTVDPGGLDPWKRDFSVASFGDGYRYEFNSQGKDAALNYEHNYVTHTFTVDWTTGVAKVTFPADSGFAGTGEVTITGVADDRFCWVSEQSILTSKKALCDSEPDRHFESGIEKSSVTVSLRDMSATVCPTDPLVDECWWNGSAWEDRTTPAWSTATFVGDSSGTWTFLVPDGALQDLRTYKVSARVNYDRAGNIQTSITTHTFSADFSAPFSTITSPTNDQVLEAITQIRGTAKDVGASGISRVWMAYYRETAPAKWWNKSTNQFDLPPDPTPTPDVPPEAPGEGSNYWVEASTDKSSPVVNWYATGVSTPSFPSVERIYHALSVAVDKGLSTESMPAAPAENTNRIRFTFRPPQPRSVILNPGEETHYTPQGVTLGGTANDVTTELNVKLIDITDGTDPSQAWVWDSQLWRQQDVFDEFVDTTTWNDPGPGVDSTWGFSIYEASWTSKGTFRKFMLKSQAWTPGESPQERTFYIDAADPQVGVTMPDRGFKRSLAALSGTATDNSDFKGEYKSVYFRLKRNDNGNFFSTDTDDYASSGADCRTAATTDATCLPAAKVTGSEYRYVHAKITSGELFTHGNLYTAYVVARDAANRSVSVPKEFRWDQQVPSVYIVKPDTETVKLDLGQYQHVRSLAVSSGSAADGYSMDYTLFSIESHLTGKCYKQTAGTGGNFESDECPNWVTTSSDTAANWWYNLPNLQNALQAYGNTWYTIVAKPVDTAGNEPAGFVDDVSSRTFLFDNTPPIVGIDFPASGGTYQGDQVGGVSPKNFRGTTSDPGAPWNSGIRRAQIRIVYLSDNSTHYWQPGVGWTLGTGAPNEGFIETSNKSDSSWADVTVIPAWLAADTEYRLEVRTEDKTFVDGEVESGNLSASATHFFVIDDTLPGLLVQQPGDVTAVNSLPLIQGTANADRSGLDKVEVRIQRQPPGADEDWTGSTWTALNEHYSTATFSGLNGDITWTYDDLISAFANNEQYKLFVRVTDKSGNVREAPGGGDRTFLYDSVDPTLSFKFPHPSPDHGYYSNVDAAPAAERRVTLSSGIVADPGSLPSGVSEVWLAVSSGTDQDTWWDKTTGRFTNGPGVFSIQWATQVYQGGTLWSTAPWTWMLYNDPANEAFKNGAQYTIHLKAKDKAGNWLNDTTVVNDSSVKFEFRYDVARPTSTVTAPANGSNVKTLDAFSGGAVDTGGSGVRIARVAVQYTDGPNAADIGKWWKWSTGKFEVGTLDYPTVDLSAWAWVATTSAQGYPSVGWSTPVPSGMLVSSSTYRLVVSAQDWATNLQPEKALVDGTGSYFRFDNEAPTLSVTAPTLSNLNPNTLGSMAGQAADKLTGNSGLKSIEVLLKSNGIPGEGYWTGTDNNAPGDWDTASPSKYDRWQTVSGDLNNWSGVFPRLSFLDSTRFTLWVRATDNAANISTHPALADTWQMDNDLNADSSQAITFTYDESSPTSRVAYPAPYARMIGFTAISGTSEDEYEATRWPSGVNKVYYKVKRSDDQYWMLMGGWGPDPGWVQADGVDPWTKAIDAANFGDGYRYDVQSQAGDAAGNLEDDYVTYAFVVDQTSAASKVAVPGDLKWVGALTTISGTAEDRYCQLKLAGACPGGGGSRDFQGGIERSSVTVALMRKSDAKWWDGDGWDGPGPVWSTGTFVGDSSGTWTYALPPGALADASSYTALSRVNFDRAGNTQTDIATNTFTIDTQDPASMAGYPTSVVNTVTTITGTARDPELGKLSRVLLWIKQVSGIGFPAVWNGTGWESGSPERWVGTGTIQGLVSDTTYYWSFDSVAMGVAWRSNADYEVKARAADEAGRFEGPHATAELAFKMAGPQSGVTTPGSGEPNYKPANLTAIIGTALNATTAQVRLVSAGVDNVLDDGDDDYAWNGSAWVSTKTFAGFLGVKTFTGAGTVKDWTFDFDSAKWETGKRYKAVSKGVNEAAEPDDYESDYTGEETRQFVIDDAQPAVNVTLPSAAAYRRGQLATLSGQATDAAPGTVSSVKFRLLRLKGTKQWHDVSKTWEDAGTDLAGADQGGGVYTRADGDLSSDLPWVDGYLYKVRITGTDKAGNASSADLPLAGFRYDMSLPTATVTAPQAGIHINTVGTLKGTMTDRDPDLGDSEIEGSGVASVDVFVQALTGSQKGKYFNGSLFESASPVPLPATLGAGTWQYTGPDLEAAAGDGLYSVYARATDAAGNVQTTFESNGSSLTFLVDKTKPTQSLTSPAGSAYTAVAIRSDGISGLSSDPLQNGTSAGIKTLGNDILLWYVQDNTSYYWNGAAWGAVVSTLTPDGASWILTQPSEALWKEMGDMRFYVKARAHDATVLGDGNVSPSTGNASLWTSEVAGSTKSFVVDDTLPVSSMTWPADGLYMTAISSITGTASAALSGIQTVEVRISTNETTGPWWDGDSYEFTGGWRTAKVTGSSWEYPADLGDTLSGAFSEGKKHYIRCRVRDNASNDEQSPPVIGVMWDVSAPSLVIKFPHASPDHGYYSNINVTPEADRKISLASGTVSDPGALPSGISEVWLAVSSGTDQDTWWDKTTGRFTNGPGVFSIQWATQVYQGGTLWSTAPWTWGLYNTPPTDDAFANGARYTLHVKAKDKAGNWVNGTTVVNDSMVKFEFRYDVARPTSTVTAPANGSNVKTLDAFSGGAVDTGGSGVR